MEISTESFAQAEEINTLRYSYVTDSPALQPEQLEVLPHAVHGVEHVGTGGLAP